MVLLRRAWSLRMRGLFRLSISLRPSNVCSKTTASNTALSWTRASTKIPYTEKCIKRSRSGKLGASKFSIASPTPKRSIVWKTAQATYKARHMVRPSVNQASYWRKKKRKSFWMESYNSLRRIRGTGSKDASWRRQWSVSKPLVWKARWTKKLLGMHTH